MQKAADESLVEIGGSWKDFDIMVTCRLLPLSFVTEQAQLCFDDLLCDNVFNKADLLHLEFVY
jgi:hypothetical protein